MEYGITILPELAAMDLTKKQMELVRHFKRPRPMREVGLVVHRDFVKTAGWCRRCGRRSSRPSGEGAAEQESECVPMSCGV